MPRWPSESFPAQRCGGWVPAGNRAATAASPADLNVYPNPAQGVFAISYRASAAQAATLTLADRLGRVVHQERVQLQAGANQFSVQTAQPAQGLYQLMLSTASGLARSQKVGITH